MGGQLEVCGQRSLEFFSGTCILREIILNFVDPS